jgi:hypothetical protein
MLKFIKSVGYKQTPSGSKRKIGLFKCACGKEKEICIYNVKSKHTLSCGCANIKQITKLGKLKGKDRGNTRHGMFGTRFYHLYYSIHDRTKNNPNSKTSRFYGNRGIKNDWKSFDQFYNDMYESYLKHVKEFGEKNTTIDRKNSLGNYNKENCQWATTLEQGKNRRNNLLITINNETRHLAEWVRILGLKNYQVRKKYLEK